MDEMFSTVDKVLNNDLKFKQKLAIGEDAYTTLKIRKKLFKAFDVAGVAGTAAGVAGSTTVATTFFGTFWTSIGIGTAVTPVGWLIAAGALGGAAWIGATRYMKGSDSNKVIVIPNYINTPLDMLATSLFDMLSFLALKVSEVDGFIDSAEREIITNHFVNDWGYDQKFVEQNIPFIEQQLAEKSISEQAQLLADFKESNPDCNYQEMTKSLLQFLNELIEADGVIDEREEMAIERIEKIFSERTSMNSKIEKTFNKVRILAKNKLLRN